jgi:glycerate 2-kinase
VRVLVSPDKFKGTLTAAQAGDAIAAGWRRARPNDVVDQLPLADGGEGTLDALVEGLGGERRALRVTGPLGDPVDAEYGLVESAEGLTGVVEMARASGLQLLRSTRRDPLRATTRGTGELMVAACHAGARTLMVCIGGSGTNDGGAGMAQAMGIRLLDAAGQELRPGGAALRDLARIDLRPLDTSVGDVAVIVASDVDNPLVGPSGASRVYGPQKGARPDDVAVLDEALAHFAAVIHRDLGIDVRDVPGAGAAGGLGAGLVAFLGARIRPGVDVVMDAVGFQRRLQEADVVVTGEGSFDEQSLRGKVAAGVLRSAAEARVRAIVLAGRRSATAPDGAAVVSLVERFGEEPAMARPRWALEELAFQTASAFDAGGGKLRARPSVGSADR